MTNNRRKITKKCGYREASTWLLLGKVFAEERRPSRRASGTNEILTLRFTTHSLQLPSLFTTA